jgi:hypothetical protein
MCNTDYYLRKTLTCLIPVKKYGVCDILDFVFPVSSKPEGFQHHIEKLTILTSFAKGRGKEL